MPSYNDLRPRADLEAKDYALVFPAMTAAEKRRAIDRLLLLRQGLAGKVADKRVDKNLIVASWNLKELGHTTQRLPEAYFYIAEIISRFDILVVQEVKSKLDQLRRLMAVLGDDWAFLINDITDGTKGNRERSAYIYNRSRVQFAGLAGELTAWDDLTAAREVKQLKRTPYITGFRAGWKTFALINVHLHPGDGDEDVDYRSEEVALLLDVIEEKRKKGHLFTEHLIIAGDFNFYEGKDDATVSKIGDRGFREVTSLIGVDTNASQTECYDRFFISKGDYFEVASDPATNQEIGGVLDPFEFVYKVGEDVDYEDAMKEVYTGSGDLDQPTKRAQYFAATWRRNQLSDHFPIWFELVIDSSDTFLKEKLEELPDG